MCRDNAPLKPALLGIIKEIRMSYFKHHNWISLVVIVVLYTASALLVTLVSSPVVLKIVCIFIMGIILSGMLNLAHECLHKIFTKGTRLNNVVGIIAAGLVLINYYHYRSYHMAHHRGLGTIDDPEDTYLFKSKWAYVKSMSGLSFFLKHQKLNILALRGFKPEYKMKDGELGSARVNSVGILVWQILLVVCTAYFLPALILVYWLPLLFSYSLVVFFGLPEHYGCVITRDISLSTRSIDSNSFIRFFQWHANYHAEHHLNPGIESYKLRYIYIVSTPCEARIKSYLRWHLNTFKNLGKSA